jgi:hypothetical protein
MKCNNSLLDVWPGRASCAGVFLAVRFDESARFECVTLDPCGVKMIKQMSIEAVRDVLQYLAEHLRPGLRPGQDNKWAKQECEVQKEACKKLLEQLGRD